MILYSTEKEYKLMVLEMGLSNDQIEIIIRRLMHYVDPKGVFPPKYSMSDGLPPVLGDEDYNYLEKSLIRVRKLEKEIVTLNKKFDSAGQSSFPTSISSATLLEMKVRIFSYINYVLFQDVKRMLNILPKDWKEILTNHPSGYHRAVSNHRYAYVDYYDFGRIKEISFETCKKFIEYDSKEGCALIDELKKLSDKISPSLDQRLCKRIGDHEDTILAGWFDEISKLLPENDLVIRYRNKLCSKDSLEKFDIASMLYFSQIITGKTMKEVMNLSSTYLLTTFWENVNKIKDSLVGESVEHTPLFLINTFWSMFQD